MGREGEAGRKGGRERETGRESQRERERDVTNITLNKEQQNPPYPPRDIPSPTMAALG